MVLAFDHFCGLAAFELTESTIYARRPINVIYPPARDRFTKTNARGVKENLEAIFYHLPHFILPTKLKNEIPIKKNAFSHHVLKI